MIHQYDSTESLFRQRCPPSDEPSLSVAACERLAVPADDEEDDDELDDDDLDDEEDELQDDEDEDESDGEEDEGDLDEEAE